jgi:hypothetical protein
MIGRAVQRPPGGLDKSAVRGHSLFMRIGVVLLLNLFAMTPVAVASETLPVLQAGNEVYSNVTVLSVSAADIYFTSDRGLANAKLKDLDPALQKQFNFNSTNAAAIEQKQKMANDEYHLQLLKQPASTVSMDEAAPPPGAANRAGHGQANLGQAAFEPGCAAAVCGEVADAGTRWPRQIHSG